MAERPDPATLRRWRAMLAAERDAEHLYRRLAAAEQGERQEIFLELAAVERRHGDHWAARLAEAGERADTEPGPTLRTRLLGALAGRLSTAAVLPLIERQERADAGMYDADPDALPGMSDDERGHARALAALRGAADPGRGATGAGQPGAAVPPGAAGRAQERIGRGEPWHRGDRSGSLRAAVFGVSDGLVSNTALVMGFAGSGAAQGTVVLAGVAGLLAGAFSMAAGEYVSMAGQRDMYRREIDLEAEELQEKPEEEREELVLLYRAKGLDREQARAVADRLMADPAVALDTLAREELGLDPEELGSPWRAALSSLLAFAVGACVVVLPYLVTSGTAAFVAAITLSLLSTVVVGAAIGALNGRSAVRGALRQLTAGVLAAAVTYGTGLLLGTTVS